MIEFFKQHKWLWAILMAYAALAAIFCEATPALEASDEARHFGYVIELVRQGELPRARIDAPGLARQEATQPPLYYALAALFTRGVSLAGAEKMYRWRPDNPVGRADLPGHKHMWLSSENKAEPSAAIKALYRIRWFSIFLGGIAVFATWFLCLEFKPWFIHTPVLASGLVAFNPMFLFITSSVNNDALIMPLSCLALLALVKSLKRPAWLWGAGIITALAVMTKLSALTLFLPGMIVVWHKKADLFSVVRRGLGLLVPAALICGWWFVRNWLLYGEVLANEIHRKIAGNARSALEPLALLKEWDGFVKSFWGVFGGFNIVFPDWVYYVFFGLSAFSLAAVFILRARRDADRIYYWILTSQVGANLGAVAVWTSVLWGSQGRLVFPSLGAIACLFAWEQDHWSGPKGPAFSCAVLLFLLGVSLWAGLSIIPGSYPWVVL